MKTPQPPDDPRSGDRWEFLISDNKVGVAKGLVIRNQAGKVVTLVEATSNEAWHRWKEVIRLDPCAYCGGLGGTIDHIAPNSMGGSRWSLRNWTGACFACNARRGATRLLYFLSGHPDVTAETRHELIKRRYRERRVDVGPAVRAALEGVVGKENRRRVANIIMKRFRGEQRVRNRAWRKEKHRLQRELVGIGQAALDDPTALQGRLHTEFGRLTAQRAEPSPAEGQPGEHATEQPWTPEPKP